MKMKRTDFITEFQKILERYEDCKLNNKAASEILAEIEKLGMKPPTLPQQYCQAILKIYCAGYTFNQWEEEIEKDEHVMAAKSRRDEYDSLTPEQRVERVRAARDRRMNRRKSNET